MPQRKPTDEVARQRQAEMKSAGVTNMVIGGLLLLGGILGIAFVAFSTLGIALELGAMVLGYVLLHDGYKKYEAAEKVERDMYLRGQ